jgi:hypothetical protein
VNYPVDVSTCTYSATSLQAFEWPAIQNVPGQAQTLVVDMYGVSGNPATAKGGQTGPFHVIVYC